MAGAKPKRISSFSNASSSSSKNSSKSRVSLRSTFNPNAALLSTSISLDERSVSCTEFRRGDNAASSSQHSLHNRTAGCLDYNVQNVHEDTIGCLDCLEREFLANTIGKVLDSNTCTKCHKRLGSSSSSASISLYSRAEQERCRSGSPLRYYHNQKVSGRDLLYDSHSMRSADFFGLNHKVTDHWLSGVSGNTFNSMGYERHAVLSEAQTQMELHKMQLDNKIKLGEQKNINNENNKCESALTKTKKPRRVTCSDLDEQQVEVTIKYFFFIFFP